MSVTFRAVLVIILAVIISCQRPQLISQQPVKMTITVSTAEERVATLWPPKSKENAQNIVIMTDAKMAPAAISMLAQRLAAYDYQVLWVPEPAGADSVVERGSLLLQCAVARMPALPGVRKHGLLLLGGANPACPVVDDTLFQAVLFVSGKEILARCFTDTAGLAAMKTAFALIIPDLSPIPMTPFHLCWLRSPENLVWLATPLSPAEVMQSDMGPIIGRKSQLFFDRNLKGKR